MIESLSCGLQFFSLSTQRVTTSRGCANVGISRSLRDFQSPVETVLWFSWGCHLHSHLRHRPRSSRSWGMRYPCRLADRRSSRFLRGRFGSADPCTGSASIPRPRCHARHMVLLRGRVGAQVGLDLGAPAPRSAFKDVGVMEQPIQERGDGGGVAQQLPPVVHRSV
jgi:hypothetical protein